MLCIWYGKCFESVFRKRHHLQHVLEMTSQGCHHHEKSPPKMGRIFANKRNKQITGFHRTVWLREKLRMGFATVGCLMVKFPSTGSFSWRNFAPQQPWTSLEDDQFDKHIKWVAQRTHHPVAVLWWMYTEFTCPLATVLPHEKEIVHPESRQEGQNQEKPWRLNKPPIDGWRLAKSNHLGCEWSWDQGVTEGYAWQWVCFWDAPPPSGKWRFTVYRNSRG